MKLLNFGYYVMAIKKRGGVICRITDVSDGGWNFFLASYHKWNPKSGLEQGLRFTVNFPLNLDQTNHSQDYLS